VTLYDEVALMNDLDAACAGGVQARIAAATPPASVEERLAKVRALVESGHITDAEYEKRRQEILQSI
jgi:putative oligomerization/nucleic acid binding protein